MSGTDKTITGSRYIAEAFKRLDISHVFFMDASLRRTLIEFEDLGIARVLAHAEKSAAYMADGYARISSRVGVCMAQSVGAANLAAGLQDAYLHRSPVLAMTGRKEAMFRYRNAYQEIPHQPLFSAVTKASFDVLEARELTHLLPQALRTATVNSPGPVHLDLNGLGGELIESGEIDSSFYPAPALGQLANDQPIASADAIAAACQRLTTSERPVLVVGAGAIQAGAQSVISELVTQFGIPVATSLGGRGVIPTTHPLHIGPVGTYSAPIGNQLVYQADLVIYIGCHTGDQPTNNWTVPRLGTPIVQIDLDAQEIGRNYPNVCGVWGCPRQAVIDLGAALDHGKRWQTWRDHVAGVVRAWRDEMQQYCVSNDQPMRVERLCQEVSNVLPENGVIVADTGYSGIWTSTLLDLKHAEQRYLRAAGSLGWSYPAALGAKCGAPDRSVVCFTGDGGFYYHLSELETQRRRNLAVVTVVNNNSGFGQGTPKVRALYGDRPGDPDEINRFGPTDFAAVARAFGVEGIRVEDPGKLNGVLTEAIASNQPMVIDVVTDVMPRAPQAWDPPQ